MEPATVIMLHIALGGQNDESEFFINQMLDRKVYFDVIGFSYYPKWHGTLDDLRDNLTAIVNRYHKDVIVVEYSSKREEVNKIVFGLPNGKGQGTCIWEPLRSFFGRDGNANAYLKMYDGISKEYLDVK